MIPDLTPEQRAELFDLERAVFESACEAAHDAGANYSATAEALRMLAECRISNRALIAANNAAHASRETLRRGIESALAILTAPPTPKPEWQPMETAPRDGTTIEVIYRAGPLTNTVVGRGGSWWHHRVCDGDMNYSVDQEILRGWRPILPTTPTAEYVLRDALGGVAVALPASPASPATRERDALLLALNRRLDFWRDRKNKAIVAHREEQAQDAMTIVMVLDGALRDARAWSESDAPFPKFEGVEAKWPEVKD